MKRKSFFLFSWMVIVSVTGSNAFAAADLGLVREALEKQRWPAAQIHLELWLNHHPRDDDVRFQLARVLGWQGSYAAALQQYDRLLASAPQNADYLLGKALVLFWQNKPGESLLPLEQARRLESTSLDVWRLNIKALSACGRQAEAAALLAQAQQRFPNQDWSGLQPPVAAAGSEEPFKAGTEMGLGGSYEKLDNKYASWNSVTLTGLHRYGKRDSVYGGLEEADRFGLTDMGMHAGFATALDERWTATLEGFGSPTQHFLARWSGLGGLHYRLDGGWGIGVTFKHSAYLEQNSQIGTVTLEKYLGNFRVAYTLYTSQLQTAPAPTFSHLGQLSYYYGDRDHVGIGIGGGQQAVRLGPGRLENANTETYTLAGQHWLSNHWALTYEVGLNVQGTSYTRKGGGFGFRYQF